MRFTLKEFSFLTASKHFGSAMIDSISFDSRNVKKGTLFVAIRGKNSDGFDWVSDAISNGASAILTTNSNFFKAKEIIAKGFPIAFAEVICYNNFCETDIFLLDSITHFVTFVQSGGV